MTVFGIALPAMKNRTYIYLASVGHMAVDTAQGALPALLPLFITAYGLNYRQAAGLMFANTVLSSVAQPLFGWLSDKKSVQWLIPLGVLLAGWSIAGMGWADSYWELFILSMTAGLGSAVFHPEAARLVNRMSEVRKKGKSMGIFAVGGNAGFAVGPLLAGTAYWWGGHALLLFFLINTLIALVILFCLPKVAARPAAAVGEARNDWKKFGILSMPILARSVNLAVLDTFIPLYWIHVLKQSEEAGNLALTVFFSIGVAVTLLGGMLSDRIGYIKVLRYANWLLLPSLLLFVNTDSVWLATLLLVPLGFGVSSQYSPMVVLGQKYLAKSVGFAAGITLGLGITLGGIFSPAVGWLADHYGLPAALQVLLAVTLLGLVFTYRLDADR